MSNNRGAIIHKLTCEDINKLHMIGVYIISNKTNKFVYIGSTTMKKGFIRRWLGHCSDLKLNKHHSQHLQNHVNKYGIEDLEFSILEIVDNPCDCRIREKYWLDYYGFENTFNISKETDISVGGKNHPCYKEVDDDGIIKMFHSGVKLSKIANAFNINKAKVISTLRLNGISCDYVDTLPLKEIYYRNIMGGERLMDIAKEYNINRVTLEKRFRKIGLGNRFQIIDAYYDRAKKFVLDGGSIETFCNKLPFDPKSFKLRFSNEEKN